MRTFPITAAFARRFPDPVFKDLGIERHVLMVPISGVPDDLPMDPNARVPNVRRTVYRDVRRSLLKDDGMFHLKHKGITIVARDVKKLDEHNYMLELEDGEGVLDGGHTYQLICEENANGNVPASQFVKVEVLTNVPSDWIADISDGLNTSVQVQDMSLDNLRGHFEWLKDLIEDESYKNAIAWRENEFGEFDARDLVSILTCFNVDLFPNNVSDTQPVTAYEKKSAALRMYEEKQGSYEKLAPIVKDILRLYDIISFDARSMWNEEGGSFGKLAWVECRKKGFDLFFISEHVECKLVTGALYPILAAFRWMVEEDHRTGKFTWRGGFESVLHLWQQSGVELLKMTHQASVELGRNPNAIGKSRNHWANLFARVAMRDLLNRSSTPSPVSRRRR